MLLFPELNKNPVEGFSAGLIDDDDIYKWEVVIIGPQDTLFEGGFFKAYLTFPYDYPLRPPKMKFITEIWHPNVAKNGDVCISILHEPGEDKFGYEKPEERWLPIHTVETIMISVISMLADPNSDSPANVDAAQVRELYRGSHMPAGGQHMTVHIPKSMMSAPFLQHPALTSGQRRYLCSIANVYSTEHMRQQMKQHYLSVLHAYVQSGSVLENQRVEGQSVSEAPQRGEAQTGPEAAAAGPPGAPAEDRTLLKVDVEQWRAGLRVAREHRSLRALSARAPSSSVSMNCVLEGNGVKAFGKAIHALARIGDELWLDPMFKGLALRSVNSAHSAYACFLFSPLFFQHYSLLGSVSEPGNETVKCKLVMKAVLPLFRCLTSIERNVERCQISIITPSDRVMIQFFCRHGITKTHNLRFQESEALQAVFASQLCPNVLKAPARLLGDMVMHFPVSQEITLSTTPLRVSLRNYYEGGNDHTQVMYSEMSLHPDEFDYFQIGEDSDITFCLKELRGLLSFAESHCLPVSVHFGAAGKPVCFSVEDGILEATVVLATLVDSESRGPSQPAETVAPTTPRCADAAVPPVGSCEAGSGKPQDIPAVTELIASSQGSHIIDSPALMQLLPQTDHPEGPSEPNEAYGSAPVTPASSTICSLLFRALSSEQDTDSHALGLPVLACYSDGEENLEEDCPRSLLL
ncbi:hypothetical protein L3Q82_022762 [Scortum barcoo]|uniref:Uncharacterized protein n=1 Tax=Scortum barcoo TaxID=214431 RepID=A0ACB8WX00_9TELE|nr:hypothetical protein L3Q82_022762 [Scortum barcoo]